VFEALHQDTRPARAAGEHRPDEGFGPAASRPFRGVSEQLSGHFPVVGHVEKIEEDEIGTVEVIVAPVLRYQAAAYHFGSPPYEEEVAVCARRLDRLQQLGDEKLAREFYSRIHNLQPEDIADAVMYLLLTPPHVQIHDIIVRPTEQEY
jgi:hypothetical protein